MQIKSVREIKNLKNKRVMVRTDYNLSINGGKLDFADDLRIRASLETIRFLSAGGATVILVAHLDRPDKWNKKLTLLPIARHLEKLLKKKVHFVGDDITKQNIAKKIKRGVYLLENIRFYDGEVTGDEEFTAILAKLADIYVNEGFSVSHRDDASVSGVPKILPAFAGLRLEQELVNLSRLLPENIKKENRPYVALLGGAKISTKIKLIDGLLQCADKVLIGGALINDILKMQGWKIGDSLVDGVDKKILKNIIQSKRSVFPKDFVVGKTDGTLSIRTIRLQDTKNLCRDGEKILDIGPETILEFAKHVKTAQTVMWNGPMGYFEIPVFAYGTLSLARIIAARGRGRAFAAVGGGETVAALNLTKMEKFVDWVSTGGGAMMSFLAGEEMPGLKQIIK
jgi:3-phosphoglycerate kinase